ncbi:MAG: ribulose-phosphate 3-epimerase [Algisphaera sp.]
MLNLKLGVKSDPVSYRYSYPWLFKLMAQEGVTHLQLGTFVELYHLPDESFTTLRKQAADHGITIDSLFTAHRELGGFFQTDPTWAQVARKNYERLIEVGALIGAKAVGTNPGAVMRDRMDTKAQGLRCYIDHMKELMGFAHQRGIDWLTIEPMSCLAEPPTIPDEIRTMGDELTAYHRDNPKTTSAIGYCADISHGYLDANGKLGFDHIALFEAALPYMYEVHLKNTDAKYHSTFGFQTADLDRGVVDLAQFSQLLHQQADQLPVDELICYLEIGGPKLGRDYSDVQLEAQLRDSLQYIKQHFLETPAETTSNAPAASAVASITTTSNTANLTLPDGFEVGPSMMCVDQLNFGAELKRVEALGVGYLHLDIMDGHFVPNLHMGMGVIQALRSQTQLPLDVHLMVTNPDLYIDMMQGWGIDRVTVHVETCTHLDGTLGRIRDMGAKAGVAINPATPLEVLDYLYERIDYVMLMTVNPGFAGQKLTPASLRKIADCRQRLDAAGRADAPIQVDGNVSFENIPNMVAAGADSLVAGTSSVFHKSDTWPANLARMTQAASEGFARRAPRTPASS